MMNNNNQLPDTPQPITEQNASALSFRIATEDDLTLLSSLNQQLIHDEKSRNPMNIKELEERMQRWLEEDGYQGVLFQMNGLNVGYALYRFDQEYVYLRQFYVKSDSRRLGVGRAAIQWLMEHKWDDVPRIRLEVLMSNEGGIHFWKALGFSEYCITMEKDVKATAKRDFLR